MGLLRQRPRAVSGSLRVVACSPPIAGGLLLIAFVLPRFLPFHLPAAGAFVRGQHAPFVVALTLLVSARSRAHAVQPRAALLHGDVPRCVPAVALRNGILCVERGRRRTRCSHPQPASRWTMRARLTKRPRTFAATLQSLRF